MSLLITLLETTNWSFCENFTQNSEQGYQAKLNALIFTTKTVLQVWVSPGEEGGGDFLPSVHTEVKYSTWQWEAVHAHIALCKRTSHLNVQCAATFSHERRIRDLTFYWILRHQLQAEWTDINNWQNLWIFFSEWAGYGNWNCRLTCKKSMLTYFMIKQLNIHIVS